MDFGLNPILARAGSRTPPARYRNVPYLLFPMRSLFIFAFLKIKAVFYQFLLFFALFSKTGSKKSGLFLLYIRPDYT